jgi:HD superfamily phosphodiesterase
MRNKKIQLPRLWLNWLKDDLKKITSTAAKDLWPVPNAPDYSFFNYRLEHVLQVERDALTLADSIDGDEDVILAAAWIHDRFQPAFTGERHGVRAAIWSKENLALIGFPQDKVQMVCQAVENHSSPAGALKSEIVEARIIWDADKLAHLGPFEIIVNMFNNISNDRLFRIRRNIKSNSDDSIMDFLWNNCFSSTNIATDISRMFYFKESQILAKQRIQAQRSFIRCLGRQINR